MKDQNNGNNPNGNNPNRNVQNGGNKHKNNNKNMSQNGNQKNGQKGNKNQNGEGRVETNGKQNANANVNGGNKQNGNKQNNQKQNSQKQNNQNAQKQNGKQNANVDNRKDVYAYALDGNLYINLTNKCSNGCSFCVRNERASYYGNYLWIKHGDPTAEKVISAIGGMGDIGKFKEVVFCGFGEPTYKVAEMVAVADYVHSKGGVTRLNTNGQGNLINKRDIVPELKGKIDKVNISLNASSAEKYQPICRSMFGEAGYTAILDFARSCKRNQIECRFSVVDVIGEEEVSACKRVADSVGVPLYVRKYITDS
jgi:TatD DNase family protein